MHEYPQRMARIASVLFLVGSLVWVQWPIDFERFSPVSVVTFIASLIAWISLEAADYQKGSAFQDNILSDDVEKLNTILDIINSKQYYVLKHLNIETYFPDEHYDGIRNLIYYNENDIFPFHNQKIQALYEKFSRDSREFYFELYLLYTSDGSGRSTWRTRGEGYVPENIYREIQAKIAALNSKASDLANLWEDLIKTSRMELKGGSKKIQQYDI